MYGVIGSGDIRRYVRSTFRERHFDWHKCHYVIGHSNCCRNCLAITRSRPLVSVDHSITFNIPLEAGLTFDDENNYGVFLLNACAPLLVPKYKLGSMISRDECGLDCTEGG